MKITKDERLVVVNVSGQPKGLKFDDLTLDQKDFYLAQRQYWEDIAIALNCLFNGEAIPNYICHEKTMLLTYRKLRDFYLLISDVWYEVADVFRDFKSPGELFTSYIDSLAKMMFEPCTVPYYEGCPPRQLPKLYLELSQAQRGGLKGSDRQKAAKILKKIDKATGITFLSKEKPHWDIEEIVLATAWFSKDDYIKDKARAYKKLGDELQSEINKEFHPRNGHTKQVWRNGVRL